jgi:hypothetical protein
MFSILTSMIYGNHTCNTCNHYHTSNSVVTSGNKEIPVVVNTNNTTNENQHSNNPFADKATVKTSGKQITSCTTRKNKKIIVNSKKRSSEKKKKISRKKKTHSSPKWHKKTDHTCGVCCMKNNKYKTTCNSCETSFCDLCDSVDGVNVQFNCHFCDSRKCISCGPFFQAGVLSSSWKGKEKRVEFCSIDCAKESLDKCQRSKNPIYRVIYSEGDSFVFRTRI